MKITKAQNTDHKRLTDLTIRSKAYWNYSPTQIHEWKDALTISAQYIDTNEVYNLLDLDTLIGYYSFFSENKKKVVLDNIFIEPQYIGRGYGRMLMQHFLEKVKYLGFEKVSLHSEPNAAQFYANMGFKVVGQLETSIKNRFLPIMELDMKNNPQIDQPTNKPKLLILSDLWGFRKCDWINEYRLRLKSKFELQYYDSCVLGKIDLATYKEEALHQQFVNGGIHLAAKKLVSLEKEAVDILAFSVGGVIAWKAGLLGLKIRNFYSVSPTRLRYETEKPTGTIKLFFGEKDAFKPEKDWYKKLELDFEIIENKKHTIYKEVSFVETICEQLTT